MYKIVSTVLMAFILLSVVAKEGKNKSKNSVHKIIFQLTTNDTMAHKALMKQLNNITTVAPTTKIEIVCHGPGLEMLITEKSIVHQKIKNKGDPDWKC
jgi:hypothetical protein